MLLQPKLIPVDQVREALQLRTTYLQHRRQHAQQEPGSAVVALCDRMHGNDINHIHGSGIDADRVEMEDGETVDLNHQLIKPRDKLIKDIQGLN